MVNKSTFFEVWYGIPQTASDKNKFREFGAEDTKRQLWRLPAPRSLVMSAVLTSSGVKFGPKIRHFISWTSELYRSLTHTTEMIFCVRKVGFVQSEYLSFNRNFIVHFWSCECISKWDFSVAIVWCSLWSIFPYWFLTIFDICPHKSPY